jgi:hypothetical protein
MKDTSTRIRSRPSHPAAAVCLATIVLAQCVSIGALVQPSLDVVYDDEIQVISAKPMAFPVLARVDGSDIVVVAVNLATSGSVTSANALTGGRFLRDAVVDNVKQWKFGPNAKGRVVVVYRFDLLDARCVSGPSTFSRRRNVVTITTCRDEPMP